MEDDSCVGPLFSRPLFPEPLYFVKEEIGQIPEIRDSDRRILGLDKFKDFIERCKYAIRLIFQEKEIITFALLQWVVIGLVYYLFVQILGWIPDSVWNNEDKLTNILLNIVFLLWSLGCVGLAAFPIGILSGCMGASHFLRKAGYPSTIAGCLRFVASKIWALWIFHWVDGWITVNQILERLPKKRSRCDPTPSQRFLSELLYYAWKVGTIGLLPSILNGRRLIEAGKESVDFVIKHAKEAMILRGGYSLFCWIIGITAYIGSVIFFVSNYYLFEAKPGIYGFYFWMGAPLLVAVGVIVVFLRPIYVIASCKLYSDYIAAEKKEVVGIVPTSKIVSAFVAFLVLALILAVAFLYRDRIGLTKILSVDF